MKVSPWFLLVPALAALMIGLLVGPRAPDDRQAEFCVVNVHIGGPFGVSLNCDSPEEMRLARQPSALLEPQNPRQSRPGMTIAAAILAWPLAPLADLARRSGVRADRADIEPGRIDNALRQDFPGYTAYISLNIVFLLLSFYVFWLICGPPPDTSGGTIMFGSLSFLLAANDVVKAFVWSPHVQMLNIFVPAFALWAAVRASEKALFERRFALLVGAITGLGATAYPLFVIVLPCVFAAGVAALIRQWSRSALRALAVNFALLAALTLLPEALWYVFVTYRTGGFYQHELAGGQVLWMSAAWQQGLGALLAAWTHKFTSLVELAARQAIPIAALVAIIAVAMTRAWTEAARIARRQLPLLLCSAMVSLVTAAFYSSTGLITWRLAYAMLPPLIIAAGAMTLAVAAALAKHEQRMLAFACATVALLQAIFTIVKDGPYS